MTDTFYKCSCGAEFAPRAPGTIARTDPREQGAMVLLCAKCAQRVRKGGRLPRRLADAALALGIDVWQECGGSWWQYWFQDGQACERRASQGPNFEGCNAFSAARAVTDFGVGALFAANSEHDC